MYIELYTLAYCSNIVSSAPYLKHGLGRESLSDDFQISDRIIVIRDIRAGLSEDGPVVCSKGTSGVVVKIEKSEPDGIHVRLDSGNLWWFKPNQIDIV